MTRITIRPVTAVTCNDAFDVVEEAAIHVEAGRIEYVGPASEAPPFEADEERDGRDLIALPGLVNTHTHAAMTLLRGWADDMPLEAWLQTRIWPFEGHLEPDDIYWGTMLAIAEMLRNGVTCFADMYFHYRRATEAILESGIRGCPAGVLIGVFPDADRQIDEAIEFVREVDGEGDGRVRPLLSPHSLYTCDRDQWKRMIEAAGTLGVALHTHASETRHEVEEVERRWGATPIQTLDALGALEVPLLAAHCVHLDERDLEIVCRRRDGASAVRVSHNPTSNAKLASGVAPLAALLERGATVGLGTDGAASNNRLDVWAEMRLAALLHKATSGEATAVTACEALQLATLEGARALGLEEEIGSLEAGKRADIVLVDFARPHLEPRHSVVSHLVYAAQAADVTTVMVDGRVLVDAGEPTGLDLERIRLEVGSRARRLAARAAAPAG